MLLLDRSTGCRSQNGRNVQQHVRPCSDGSKRRMSDYDVTGVESTGTTTAESPLETTTAIDWDGPFCERDAYGDPTGYTYVRCPDCRIEVLTGQRDHATHRSECVHR